MDIMFKNYDNSKVAYLPHVPPGVEIPAALSIEEIDTINGKITKTNTRELRTLTIDAIFPVMEYSWVNKNANMKAFDYIQFFTDAINYKQTLGIHIVSKSGYYMLSMKCKITSFQYSIDRGGDLSYSLNIMEYRDLKAVKV